MRRLAVLEHGRLEVGAPGESSLTPAEARAVHAAQRAAGVGAFTWDGPARLKAAQFVGVLATPAVEIEILPKVDGLSERGGVRELLVRMLGAAWNLPLADAAAAGHRHGEQDLLERVIGVFADRLLAEVRRGLPRAYNARAEDLPRLRGRLDVARQFTRLAAHPERLACRFDELDPDTPLNRLMTCAVGLLLARARAEANRRKLVELTAAYEGVARLSAGEALRQALHLDRTARAWRDLAALARFLLQASYQTTSLGDRLGIALLFDMNRLFEAYVAAEARRALTPLGWRVRAQGPVLCLARDEAGKRAFATQPDLHLLSPDGRRIVLDTKWKRLDADRADGGVAQADAYQMNGYAGVYETAAVILLYPHAPGRRPAGVLRSWRLTSGGAALTASTVALTPERSVGDQLRTLLQAA